MARERSFKSNRFALFAPQNDAIDTKLQTQIYESVNKKEHQRSAHTITVWYVFLYCCCYEWISEFYSNEQMR